MAAAFLSCSPVVTSTTHRLPVAATATLDRHCAWTPAAAPGRPRARGAPHDRRWWQRWPVAPAVGCTPRRGPLPLLLSPVASAAAGNTGGGGDTDEPSPPSPGTPPPSRPRLRRYISSAQGRSLVTEAITTTFGGSAKAYATAAAGSVVDAITATYTIGGGEAEGEGGGGPPSVLVAFGVGLTGAVGVETAVGLAAVGYSATLLRVGEEDGLPPWRVDAEAAAEAAGIDIIEFVPAGTAFYFDLLVDAVIGNDPLDWGDGVDPDDAPVVAATALTPPLLATTADAASGGLIPDGATTVLAALASSSVPVVCVDHPLGWATDRGPPDLAVRRDSFVKPDLLVSTAVPLRSARFFGGRYHYVGGGVVPPGWGAAAGVAVRELPPAGGVRAVLFSGRTPGVRDGGSGGGGVSSGVQGPALPGGLSGGVSSTGDVYGGMGGEEGAQGWMGTLFVKDGRREWVHVEDNDDLWDELE